MMKNFREKAIDLRRCFVDDGRQYSQRNYAEGYADKTNEFSWALSSHSECMAALSLLNRTGNWFNGKVNVLDFGCGTGVNLARFYQFGRIAASRLVGVDQNRECIEKARQLHPGFDFRLYAGDQIPYPSGDADLVTAFHSLAHVESVAKTLDELYRVTAPDGRLIVVTPNRNYVLAMSLTKNLFNDYMPDTTILRHFSLLSLQQALWCAGFTIEHRQYFGERPFEWMPHCFRSRLIVVARKLEKVEADE